METVILCGGQGTRIRDVSDDIPKPMINIGDRPILWHIMKGFAHHGYDRFVLCLGYKGSVIKRYCLDYCLNNTDFTVQLGKGGSVTTHSTFNEDWTVTLAETGLHSMTGHRVYQIRKYITADTFMLTYGDGVSDVDIGELVRFHKSHGKIATVTAVRPRGRFGEMELVGDKVVEFNEKPYTSRGWINGGFFVFNRQVFDYLADEPDLILEQSPLISLARDGELVAYQHDGFWQPMDTSRDHKYLNDLWTSGQADWCTWGNPRKRMAA